MKKILIIILCCLAKQAITQCTVYRLEAQAKSETEGAFAMLEIAYEINDSTFVTEKDRQIGKWTTIIESPDTIIVTEFQFWGLYGDKATGMYRVTKVTKDSVREFVYVETMVPHWDTLHYFISVDCPDCEAYGESKHCRGYPNAFSPNGDGINDTYFNTLGEEFSVYSDWGGLVYHGIEWSGLGFDRGVYVIKPDRGDCEPFGVHLKK